MHSQAKVGHGEALWGPSDRPHFLSVGVLHQHAPAESTEPSPDACCTTLPPGYCLQVAPWNVLPLFSVVVKPSAVSFWDQEGHKKIFLKQSNKIITKLTSQATE